MLGGPCAGLLPSPDSTIGLGRSAPYGSGACQVDLGARVPGRLGVPGDPAAEHHSCLPSAACSKHDLIRDGSSHLLGGWTVNGDSPGSGDCLDLVLLRIGGLAEGANQALRGTLSDALGGLAQSPPCAVRHDLRWQARGATGTTPSRIPRKAEAGTTPTPALELTRSGLGATRTLAAETWGPGATGLLFFFPPEATPPAATGPTPPLLLLNIFFDGSGCSTSEGWIQTHTYIHTYYPSLGGL